MSRPENVVYPQPVFGLVDIEIDSFTGYCYQVTVDPTDEVKAIKQLLDELWDIPASRAILLFNGRELKNYEVIMEVGIKAGSKLQLLLNMSGGPYNIKKVYGPNMKSLKSVVEQTRKELCKKYPDGIRVLVILHRNYPGQFKVLRIYDGIQDGQSSFENGSSLRPKSPTTPPKPSSPCKLLKYRRSYNSDIDSKELKVKVKDHWLIVKKLANERKMKLKLRCLRKKMLDSSKAKRLRTGSRRLTKLEKSTIWYNQLGNVKKTPVFCNKVFYFTPEFDYPAFMASYYDKHELTPEMKEYKHITFRIGCEKYPSRSDGPPMVLYKEEHALKESCRSNGYYMIIENLEEQYEEVMTQHENRLSLEVDYLERVLKKGGFSVEQVEDLILEFLWSGDVSYKYFLTRSGLDDEEIKDAIVDLKYMESEDFEDIKSVYKNTIYETINPLYDENAASTSSMSPPFSDNTADRSDKALYREIQQTIKDSRLEKFCKDKNIKPIPSEKFDRNSKRRASTPCRSLRGKIPVLLNPPTGTNTVNSLRSKRTRRRIYRRASDPTGEYSNTVLSDLMCPPPSDNTKQSVKTSSVAKNVEQFYEDSGEEDNSPTKKSRTSTYQRENNPYISSQRKITLVDVVESSDSLCTPFLDYTDPLEGPSRVSDVQQDIESISDSDSLSDDSTVNSSRQSHESTYRRASDLHESPTGEITLEDSPPSSRQSNENTYRSASDLYKSPTREITLENSVHSSDLIGPHFSNDSRKSLEPSSMVRNVHQFFDAGDVQCPSDDESASPMKESNRNTYRRGGLYAFPTNEITVEDSERCDDNMAPLKKSIRNTYRSESDPCSSLQKETTAVDSHDSTDSSLTIHSRKSSTPGDSSYESDSHDQMVIDLEGGGEGKAEDLINLNDQIVDNVEVESANEILVPSAEGIINSGSENNIHDESSSSEQILINDDDLPISNIVEVNSVEEVIDVKRVDNVKETLLPPVEKVKRIKCAVCRRRLNITNMWDCRCGNVFCAQHRHAELHQCSFDYKQLGRETIAEQNPRIVGEKIRKL